MRPAAGPLPRLLLLLAAALPQPLQADRLAGLAALSPERQGLRASDSAGSSSLGVPALLERPDRLQDPRPGDLNATLLRAKLGRHFDPRVLSVHRPRTHKTRYDNLVDPDEDASDSALLDDGQTDWPFRRDPRGRLAPPVGAMPRSIAALDLGGVLMPDGTRVRTRIPPRLRRKLQNFLWAYMACPVRRRWRDLGVRFWPRWLREGHCPESPCSIPAGMHCRPAASRHQALLRWHCRPPGLGLARQCSWIKVEYPVITECSCGCGGDDHYS